MRAGPGAPRRRDPRYLDAGLDEVYVNGPDQSGFFDYFEREVRPASDLPAQARSIRIADRSLLAPTPTARSPPTAGGDVELFGLIPWQHLGADVGPVDGIVLAADDGEALTA